MTARTVVAAQEGAGVLQTLLDHPYAMQWIGLVGFGLYFALQITITIRVLMSRRGTGDAFAWIMVVFVFPIGGPLLYLALGELRLGSRRAARHADLAKPVKEWLGGLSHRKRVDWTTMDEQLQQLARLCDRTIGIPAVPDNRLHLIPTWQEVFEQLLADIEAAERTCHLEFYIWNRGGQADEVARALIRARQRGVICRVLVDSMGSRSFLRSELADEMRAAGVRIADALPGGLWRLPFVRFDLRLHRKIVVIDGRVGYTGSLNLVDPRYFKKEAGVGQWVDAMVRVEGPAVELLQGRFSSIGIWRPTIRSTTWDQPLT